MQPVTSAHNGQGPSNGVFCCAVVLRGGVAQNLDDRVLDRIDDVLDSTDLLLIVGTSSVVYLAAGYAPQVAQRWVHGPVRLCRRGNILHHPPTCCINH